MSDTAVQQLWDMLVVGSGPAGLAAAVNGRVRGKSVCVLGAEDGSGRLRKAPEIKNYLGLETISGPELMQRFLNHAQKVGAVLVREGVETIYPGDEFNVVTRSNQVYRGLSVVLTTGIQMAHLLSGEKDLLGRGLGYCATCDGALYSGQEVAVIGDGPEAVDDVNFLAGICSRVYFFTRQKGELHLDQRVVVRHEEPQGIAGTLKVTGVQLPGEVLPVAGVFIIRDVAPAERLVEGLQIDSGAIVVDHQMATSVPGVYAAGDCTGKPYQIGKAVGEGLTAGLSAVHYLDEKSKQKRAVQV